MRTPLGSPVAGCNRIALNRAGARQGRAQKRSEDGKRPGRVGLSVVQSPEAQTVGWGVEFRILGPLEVVQDGRLLALGGAQQRALLVVLLIHRGNVVSTDRLIDELWGERAPPTAA